MDLIKKDEVKVKKILNVIVLMFVCVVLVGCGGGGGGNDGKPSADDIAMTSALVGTWKHVKEIPHENPSIIIPVTPTGSGETDTFTFNSNGSASIRSYEGVTTMPPLSGSPTHVAIDNNDEATNVTWHISGGNIYMTSTSDNTSVVFQIEVNGSELTMTSSDGDGAIYEKKSSVGGGSTGSGGEEPPDADAAMTSALVGTWKHVRESPSENPNIIIPVTPTDSGETDTFTLNSNGSGSIRSYESVTTIYPLSGPPTYVAIDNDDEATNFTWNISGGYIYMTSTIGNASAIFQIEVNGSEFTMIYSDGSRSIYERE